MFAFTLNANDARAVGEPVSGFPNWAERVIHEWINRARVDPQLEMTACGSPCVERACYTVMPPLIWSQALNRSARFHSDEMVRQGYFAHNSACTVVSNINSLYPTSCDGSAACACVGGTKACPCTAWNVRVGLFGPSPSGEIIASPSDPNQSFYLWLFEQGDTANCQFDSANGHRFLILTSTGAVGLGVAGYSTGDFGSGSAPTKIPSGSHYPQQAASVATWANWYDTSGPSLATVNVDGICTAMTLGRGTQTNGAWSATVTGVGSGCHRYYFSFRDAGGALVTYPTTGSLAIGSGAACPDWDISQPAACGAIVTGTPNLSPTPTPSLTAIPSPSRTPTSIPTMTPSPSRTPTAIPTMTPSPSRTPTAIPTMTPSPSRTPTAIPTASPAPSSSRTWTPNPTTTLSPSRTPTSGLTMTPTQSPFGTPRSTPTATATPVGQEVSGSLRYYGNDAPVPQMMVYATGPTTGISSPTDTAGDYVLTNVPPEDILVNPGNTTGTGGAVTALDASYALQFAVGLLQPSAQQRLACDVSGDGNLTALDASLILQYRVGLITRFPVARSCTSDWAFIPQPSPAPNQTLIQPQPGTDTCTAGGIAYQPLTMSLVGQNFSALVFGDCDGDWQPPSGSGGAAGPAFTISPAERNGGLRRLGSGRLALPISIDAPEPVYAIEVRVTYDPAALRAVSARVVGGARHAALAFNANEAGIARIAVARGEPISANGEPVIVLMFEAPRSQRFAAPVVSVRIQ